jgi:hypothetical protein
VTKPFDRYDDTVGDLGPGKAAVKNVSAVIFGEENQVYTIPVALEYKTENSNAVFVKKMDYVLTVTTSPISVTATSVSELSSGQPLTVSVSVRSNASKPLEDVALRAEYPFGFSVTKTSVESDNGLFLLGSFEPGQEKKVTVTGVLTGENNDERVFHWSAGSVANSTGSTLGVIFATAQSEVTITRPFLDISLTLDGNGSGTPTVSAGKTVQGVVQWRNTLNVPILDSQITVALSGTAFDPNSVSSQNGFYQSADTTIRFDRDTNSGLRSIAPGDTGVGTFSFDIKSGTTLAELRNPSVTLTVSASGRRVNEAGVPDTLSSSLTRSMKIATGLNLSSRAVRTVGPFTNTGPWPPTPDTETTYTIMLTAINDVNSIGGATATMTLPAYVRFTGLTSPNDGSITYVDSTRTVKWTIGEMAPGTSKQGAFQVAFLPSISQKGTSPNLVSAQTLTGTDRFTQTVVTSTAYPVSTQTTTDPAYDISDGSVR